MCGGDAVAGQTCTVSVAFSPIGAGAKTGQVFVFGGPAGAANAQLFGTGFLPAALAITPSALSFGIVPVGSQSPSSTLQITNNGGVATGTLQTTFSGPDGASSVAPPSGCTGISLAPGSSCTLAVRFAAGLGLGPPQLVVQQHTPRRGDGGAGAQGRPLNRITSKAIWKEVLP